MTQLRGINTTAATAAVVACIACCLPVAWPAVSLAGAAGAIAWIGGGPLRTVGVTALAGLWIWVWRRSYRWKGTRPTLIALAVATALAVFARAR